jgi:putative ABC transport system permease protein
VVDGCGPARQPGVHGPCIVRARQPFCSDQETRKHGNRPVTTLARQLRHAFRTVRKASRFPAPAILSVTVALGLGAYRLFPNGEPLGKQVQVGGGDGEWYTVVGIVRSIRARGIGARAEPFPALYLSTLQHPVTVANLAVRTTGDPMGHAPLVATAIRAVVPDAVLLDAMTMEDRLRRFQAPLRWFAAAFALLAISALVLAAAGLHGLTSYAVARRTREIGIRMAVGAEVKDITRMILGQSLHTTLVGAVLGLIAVGGVARLLQLLVIGVEPFDPLVFGGVAVLLVGTALLASYRPARRAASVDPERCLRSE